MATPGTVTNCGRITLTAVSNRVCSGSTRLATPTCTTGMLEAVYLMIRGGVTPAGIWRITVCDTATTWAIAVWMLALG